MITMMEKRKLLGQLAHIEHHYGVVHTYIDLWGIHNHNRYLGCLSHMVACKYES